MSSPALDLIGHVCLVGIESFLAAKEAGISTKYLPVPDNQVWALLEKYVAKYGKVPAKSTVEEIIGADLPESPEPLKFYLHRVDSARLSGFLTNLITEADQLNLEGREDKALEVMKSRILQLSEQFNTTKVKWLGEVAQSVWDDYIEATKQIGISGIPTGWPSLDEETWGFQPEDVYVLVGHTGEGKSQLLMWMLYAARLVGKKALCVSLEMSEVQMGRRLAGIAIQADPKWIKKGILSTAGRKRLRQWKESCADDMMLGIIPYSLEGSIADLRAQILIHKPHIVYVDGAYMLKSSTFSGHKFWEKVQSSVQELKKLAMEFGIPIVAVYQFTKGAQRAGNAQSIGGGISVGQVASVGMSIRVVEEIEKEDPTFPSFLLDRDPSTFRMFEIFKGRDGEEGRFPVSWILERMNMKEIECPIY